MSRPIEAFRVRSARPEDAAVLLSQESDIPPEWHTWLADDAPNASVATLATDDQVMIGAIHMALLTPEEGCLEGAWVAPTARGRGVMTALVQHAVAWAHDQHADVIRGSAAADDTLLHSALQGNGFAQIGTFVPFAAPTAGARLDRAVTTLLHRPGPDAVDRLWAWLEHSNLVALVGGCYFEGDRAVALTDVALAGFLATGQVFTLEEFGTLQALLIAGPRQVEGGEIYAIRYLDGAVHGISRVAMYLRGQAAAAEFDHVEARPPDLRVLRDALDGAGYTGTGAPAQWLFAKSLG
jgi:GNAT superfamily N-acetyltransferase